MALAAIWVATLVWGCLYHSTVLPNAGTSIVPQRHRRRTSLLRHQHGHPEPGDSGGLSRLSAHAGDGRRIEEYRGRAVILPSSDYDDWYVAPLPDSTPEAKRKLTVYFSTWE